MQNWWKIKATESWEKIYPPQAIAAKNDEAVSLHQVKRMNIWDCNDTHLQEPYFEIYWCIINSQGFKSKSPLFVSLLVDTFNRCVKFTLYLFSFISMKFMRVLKSFLKKRSRANLMLKIKIAIDTHNLIRTSQELWNFSD